MAVFVNISMGRYKGDHLEHDADDDDHNDDHAIASFMNTSMGRYKGDQP